MSRFDHDRLHFPFNDLARDWAPEAGAKPEDLTRVLLKAALAGWFDDPDHETHRGEQLPDDPDCWPLRKNPKHGILFWPKGIPSHGVVVFDSSGLEPLYRLSGACLRMLFTAPEASRGRLPDQEPVAFLLGKVSLTREAVLTFAERWRDVRGKRINPPSWLTAPQVRVVSKTSAERECAAWIKQLASDPEFTTIPVRDELKREALKKYGGRLTGRGFDRVWEQAAPDSWKMAGRKSRRS